MTHYDSELQNLAKTYESALKADVGLLKEAIAGASESSIIGVGSGGSFTVASLLCNLHEAYTGRVSRASTPLEVICNPTLAASSPVFLISAEGKNPDIIEALVRARQHSARTVHVLTNRNESELMRSVAQLTDISKHVFELTEKDGYLATNSLLMDAVLVARAYGELDEAKKQLPLKIGDLRLQDQTIDEWLNRATDFVDSVVSRGGIIVTYSPLLRPIAADLESKLSEGALLYSQLADLRSFAHGRYLWLADRPNDCAILALIEPSLQRLWTHMQTLMPKDVPILTLPLGGAKPADLLAGLVTQMRLIGKLAERVGRDVGRPNVPEFGRDLYYVKLEDHIQRPAESTGHGANSKYEVLGARWPSKPRYGYMGRALEAYKNDLAKQQFRAIVFDYDGTLCTSQSADGPPPEPIQDELTRLISGGIVVAIASGRGGSVPENLQKALPQSMWNRVQLGLYNGGLITEVGRNDPTSTATSEFLSHVVRIVGRLQTLGVPIRKIRINQPYQVSVRFRDGISTEQMWFVIADALRQAGLDLSRMVRSKHSVDILADGVSKSHLIAHLIQKFKLEPYQVLTMGDQGAWPGNDSALLEHRFSLSVDFPSRRLDRGWNFAPPHKRGVDATRWYLERLRILDGGKFLLAL